MVDVEEERKRLEADMSEKRKRKGGWRRRRQETGVSHDDAHE